MPTQNPSDDLCPNCGGNGFTIKAHPLLALATDRVKCELCSQTGRIPSAACDLCLAQGREIDFNLAGQPILRCDPCNRVWSRSPGGTRYHYLGR